MKIYLIHKSTTTVTQTTKAFIPKNKYLIVASLFSSPHNTVMVIPIYASAKIMYITFAVIFNVFPARVLYKKLSISSFAFSVF